MHDTITLQVPNLDQSLLLIFRFLHFVGWLQRPMPVLLDVHHPQLHIWHYRSRQILTCWPLGA